MRRRLPRIVLSVLGLVAAALALLSSPRLTEPLRPQLETLVSHALGLPVRLGQLQVVALPPTVVLSDVEVGTGHTADGSRAPLWLRVGKVRLRPHWSSLMLARLVLAELTVLDASLEATLAAAPDSAPAKAAAPLAERLMALQPKLRLPFDVHTLHLEGTELRLWRQNDGVTLDNLVVEGLWTGLGRRALTLQLGHGRLHLAAAAPGKTAADGPKAEDFRLGLTSSFVLLGAWDKPRRLVVEQATLDVTPETLPLAAAPAPSPISLHGELPLAAARQDATFALTAEAKVDLADTVAPLAAAGGLGLPKALAGAAGRLSGRAELLGPFQAPWIRGQVFVEQFTLAAAPAGRPHRSAARGMAQATLRLDANALVLQQLEWAPSAPADAAALESLPPQLAATGTLHWGQRGAKGDAPQIYRAQVTLTNLAPAALAQTLGTELAGVRLWADGNVQLSGDLRQSHHTAALALQLSDVRLGESTAAPPVVAMDSLSVGAELTAHKGAWTLAHLELRRLGASLFGEGTLVAAAAPRAGPAAAPELDLRLWAGGLPLENLGPIAGLDYGGVTSFAGTLRGPLGAPTAEAAVQIDHLRVAGLAFGHAEGVLRFNAPTLELVQFLAVRGDGQLRGAATLQFAGQPRGAGRPAGTAAQAGIASPPQPTAAWPQLAVDLRGENWDVGDTLRDLGLPASLDEGLDARLWGQLTLQGPLTRPRGHAKLTLPRLAFQALDLGATEVLVALGGLPLAAAEGPATQATTPDNAAVRLRLWAHPRQGSLSAEAAWLEADAAAKQPAGLQVRLAGDDLALDKLLHGAELNVAGRLTLRLDLEGPPEDLGGTLVADLLGLSLAGAQLGGVHLVGQAAHNVAKLDLHLLQGSARLGAQLGLVAPFPLKARGAFVQLQSEVLKPLLPAAVQAALPDLQGNFTANLAFDGALNAPLQARAQLALQAAQVGVRATQLRLLAPVVLRLADGRLHVPSTTLQDDAARITVAGSVPLFVPAHGAPAGRQELDLHADVVGDLKGLRGFVTDLNAAQGPLALHLHVRGPLKRPELLGELTLKQASLRFGGATTQVQTLENVRFKALFSGRAVALTQGQAQLGRGQLHFGGELTLPTSLTASEGSLSLRLQLKEVPLAPLPDLTATVSGALELGGKLDQLTLRGDVKVHALRYTARLDLNTLVPKRAAPPLKAPFAPLGRSVRLAVKVHAPNDLVLSSKVLEAELAAELLLTGSTDRVGLLGGVTPLWARVRYNENLFNLTHATIDFTDEYRISPTYSVQAHTRACQMEADVLVQGDIDGYAVQTSGRDEHGTVDPQDVLTCLNFGLRLSDFDGNRKHTAGINDALYGSIDALWSVSGLDDKVRRLLPIRVDELRLTSGWSSRLQRTTARVLVGKELGPRLALRYSRAIDADNDQAFSLDYRLASHTSLRANWLSSYDVPVGDLGVDTRLHWERP